MQHEKDGKGDKDDKDDKDDTGDKGDNMGDTADKDNIKDSKAVITSTNKANTVSYTPPTLPTKSIV